MLEQGGSLVLLLLRNSYRLLVVCPLDDLQRDAHLWEMLRERVVRLSVREVGLLQLLLTLRVQHVWLAQRLVEFGVIMAYLHLSDLFHNSLLAAGLLQVGSRHSYNGNLLALDAAVDRVDWLLGQVLLELMELGTHRLVR